MITEPNQDPSIKTETNALRLLWCSGSLLFGLAMFWIIFVLYGADLYSGQAGFAVWMRALLLGAAGVLATVAAPLLAVANPHGKAVLRTAVTLLPIMLALNLLVLLGRLATNIVRGIVSGAHITSFSFDLGALDSSRVATSLLITILLIAVALSARWYNDDDKQHGNRDKPNDHLPIDVKD